jgi:hypothetical protein
MVIEVEGWDEEKKKERKERNVLLAPPRVHHNFHLKSRRSEREGTRGVGVVA